MFPDPNSTPGRLNNARVQFHRSERRRKHREQYWVCLWYCCQCGMGPLSLQTDSLCTDVMCQHRRCTYCGFELHNAPEPDIRSSSSFLLPYLREGCKYLSRGVAASHESLKQRLGHPTRSEKSIINNHEPQKAEDGNTYDNLETSRHPTSSMMPSGQTLDELCTRPSIGDVGMSNSINEFRSHCLPPATSYRHAPTKDKSIPCDSINSSPETSNEYQSPIIGLPLESKLRGLHLDKWDDQDKSQLEIATDSDAEASSASSEIWRLELFEDSADLPEGHPFLAYEDVILDRALQAFYTQHCAPADGTGATGETSNTYIPSSTYGQGANPGQGSRKRRSEREESNDSRDESTVTNTVKRQRLHRGKVSFACPFSKRDPVKYDACYSYRLLRIRDVKQHIYRRHVRPIYCPDCHATFGDENMRDDHIRARSCTALSPRPVDGITENQRTALSTRVSTSLSKEEQWFSVFEILFPGCAWPASPYIELGLADRLWPYMDYMDVNAPRIISEELRQHFWNTPNEEADLAAFQERIVRRGIRRVTDQWREEMRSSENQQPQAPTPSATSSTDHQSNLQIQTPEVRRPSTMTPQASQAVGTAIPGHSPQSSLAIGQPSQNPYSWLPGSDLARNRPSPRSALHDTMVANYQAFTSPAESSALMNPRAIYLTPPDGGIPSHDGSPGSTLAQPSLFSDMAYETNNDGLDPTLDISGFLQGG